MEGICGGLIQAIIAASVKTTDLRGYEKATKNFGHYNWSSEIEIVRAHPPGVKLFL
jgi:uncharacterized membrane protein YagU involved in acid resistance